jgi:hypothetical protein
VRVVIHARRGDGNIEAFATGCQAAGYRATWLRPSLWNAKDDLVPTASAVLVHGMSGNAHQIHAAYRAIGVPVWILDLPRLREELLGIGLFLNSFQWLPEQIVREPVTGPLLAERTPEVALVCGQKAGDFAHGMDAGELEQWARYTIARVRVITKLPVVYRPHPLDRVAMPLDGYGADEWSPAATPLLEELQRAALMVTHNSTAGWEAIAAGVPVFATDPACAYREYALPASEQMLRIRELEPPRRLEALGRAASSQWTMYELARPDVIRHLFGVESLPEGWRAE